MWFVHFPGRSLFTTPSTDVLSVCAVSYGFCVSSTYPCLTSTTDLVGVFAQFREKGEDHRCDYFSCCCMIACSLACDYGGGMGHNSHSLKGRSNQPQSLASGSAAFESQCFISSINYLIVALFAQGCIQKGLLQWRAFRTGCNVCICHVTKSPSSSFSVFGFYNAD